ncbi:MAG: hypothetical protein PW734_03410 [Verrucomicrobium sp.]|nr:hypothetical protein [Verrucomicrobium sp.]
MPSGSLLTLDALRAETPGSSQGRADYAVLGHPVGHSLSPRMHAAAFAEAGIAARYAALDAPPERLEEALELLVEKGFRGWNVTVPHKQAVHAWLAARGTLAPSAVEAGAVNTVARAEAGDRLTGHSTDGAGWERAVREAFGLELRGLDLLLLGAGGSGLTLARRAAAAGCRTLRVANRNPERLDALRGLSFEAVPWEPGALADAAAASALVVQTTTLGLGGAEEAPPLAAFPAGPAYYDIVYGAAPTPFLRAADAAGARTADGRSMLLHQGALAWELWTGRPAPLETMRRALSS